MENISKTYIDKYSLDEGFALGLVALYLTFIIAVAIRIGFNRKAAEKVANELLPIIKKDLDAGIKKVAPKIATIGLDLFKTLTSRNEWRQLLSAHILWGYDNWKNLIKKSQYEEFLQTYVARSMRSALYAGRGKKIEEIGLQNFFTIQFGIATYDDTYDAVYRIVQKKGIPEDSPTFEMQLNKLTNEIEKIVDETEKSNTKAAKILKPIYKLFFDNLEKLLKQKANELV